MSSPRPWGCFLGPLDCHMEGEVFPTPVGVFPTHRGQVLQSHGLPHARGGVSLAKVRALEIDRSSPRPWGCFLGSRRGAYADCVFPTPVGVFLGRRPWRETKVCLPHARGGVSVLPPEPLSRSRSSPRPWGCFPLHPARESPGPVFPTPVGVFLRGLSGAWLLPRLPHARGGVSGQRVL